MKKKEFRQELGHLYEISFHFDSIFRDLYTWKVKVSYLPTSWGAAQPPPPPFLAEIPLELQSSSLTM
jgi:hypothetical protein